MGHPGSKAAMLLDQELPHEEVTVDQAIDRVGQLAGRGFAPGSQRIEASCQSETRPRYHLVQAGLATGDFFWRTRRRSMRVKGAGCRGRGQRPSVGRKASMQVRVALPGIGNQS
ncbi:hypothetical protein H696_04543 [Fonticula alba]|uniref:Uncharacterized protein n=1 Tax=Fonticula alba TaxID=691883 RepID=A0A058Z5B5_FONAL|nr:hypothetical protein H696_04543 [Fonticula alba]KCV69128.1 hypothetical protein H696_04543 [Fonticula alba]|eukprot:XP_009496699.1 hypothetical protein H696_04543 [Fonticula alba]